MGGGQKSQLAFSSSISLSRLRESQGVLFIGKLARRRGKQRVKELIGERRWAKKV